MATSPTIAELCTFIKIMTVRHLGFLKMRSFKLSTFQRFNVRHRAKARRDRSNRCWDMAIFWFSKRRPSASL